MQFNKIQQHIRSYDALVEYFSTFVLVCDFVLDGTKAIVLVFFQKHTDAYTESKF